MSKVTIKKSKIRGEGVYASKDIKEGDVVLEIDDSHKVLDLSILTKGQKEWCDYLSSGETILMQSPERYINHSCDPTTYVRTTNGVRKVLAMRNIRRGGEVTYDYSINGYNDGTFVCSCGSAKCRGVYQGNFFKLPKNLRIKYLPYLDEWFVKEHHLEIDRLGED